MEWSYNKEIILASGSPRRKFLLTEAGFKFNQIIPKVDEDYPDDLDLQEIPVYLACKKANTIEMNSKPRAIVISADTIVIKGKVLYGKPNSFEMAVNNLKSMSNQWHEVITGVCVRSLKKNTSFSVKTQVKCESLSDEEIKFYIDNYKPFDKAGSYGIQDWLGWNKISSIKGSYSNVMGLPMAELYKVLKNIFYT